MEVMTFRGGVIKYKKAQAPSQVVTSLDIPLLGGCTHPLRLNQTSGVLKPSLITMNYCTFYNGSFVVSGGLGKGGHVEFLLFPY